MRQWLRSHLTYANVISTLALFLVVGGGTTLAATGGNFILGQSNSASSTTSLARTGANAGKGLQVSNTSTTTGATALGLNVASGHAPFTVNSGTKVTNLNADKLDGFDSTGLIRGRKLLGYLDGGDPITKLATVGPYEISGECFDDGTITFVRIYAKGPAGNAVTIHDSVNNDTTVEEAVRSRADLLSANVNTEVFEEAQGFGYLRARGTTVLTSNSGAIVQVDFYALAWDTQSLCHILGTATTAS